MPYAHSRSDLPRDHWQSVREHLEAVAFRSSEFASVFDAADWGRLAGLWHDLGKYSEEFQAYLQAASESGREKKPMRGPDHSTAGAQHAARALPAGVGRLLAYLIAGHHAGLPDGQNGEASCLASRLEKCIPEWRAQASPDVLDGAPPPIPFGLLDRHISEQENAARLGTFLRFVFSGLVDADHLDTEAFMAPDQAELRNAARPTIAQLEDRLCAHLSGLDTSRATAAVNTERGAVRHACLRAAELAPGFFSLTVPTGGGKTLSSLAFALKHARLHDLRRIVYAIPFTSIVEQNAQVFRTALGNDALLEHHCNFEAPLDDESAPWQLLVENWDAPLIATTNVQLFESLFAARPSRCRKLHCQRRVGTRHFLAGKNPPFLPSILFG